MGDFGPDLPTSRMSANAIRHTVLEGTQHISRSWLRENAIHVLPREEVTELSSSDELRFLAKLSDELVCITTADIGEQSQNQGVQIPVAQVSDWFWDHAPFDVLIASPDLHALLLHHGGRVRAARRIATSVGNCDRPTVSGRGTRAIR